MGVRDFSDAELKQIYDSISAVAPPALNSHERSRLKKELRQLVQAVATIWEAWPVSPREQAQNLQNFADLGKSLGNALRNLAPTERSILLAALDFNKVEKGQPPLPKDLLPQLDFELQEIVRAATEAAKWRTDYVKYSNLQRGWDFGARLLATTLLTIWSGWTNTVPDLWVDKPTGQYRGEFWIFARAATVTCREFMGAKGSDASLFSRLDRLIRRQARSKQPPGKQFELPLRCRVDQSN